jgi:hypothetical protein
MPGPYTVTVTPKLLTIGEYKGHLEYLHFTAIAAGDMQEWWVVNTGTLDDDFRAVFGEWGPIILNRLRKQTREGQAPASTRT